MRAPLIVFSGIDGAGKTTQIELLLAHLRQVGASPVYLWTRGGYTPLFEKLKAAIRRSPLPVIPPPGHSPERTASFRRPAVARLWLVAALLDLMWVYAVQIRWWRMRGRTVVCDRYLDDTLIDFALNFPNEHITRWGLWRLLRWLAPAPTVTFVLLVAVEESVRRSALKGEPYPDPLELLARRLALYRALPGHPTRLVLDGRHLPEDLATQIWATLPWARASDLSVAA